MSRKAIEVRIRGQSVGAVALDPRSGFYAFATQPEWLAGGHPGSQSGFRQDRDLLMDAERFRVRRPGRILDGVRAALASFGEFALEAGLPGAKADAFRSRFLLL